MKMLKLVIAMFTMGSVVCGPFDLPDCPGQNELDAGFIFCSSPLVFSGTVHSVSMTSAMEDVWGQMKEVKTIITVMNGVHQFKPEATTQPTYTVIQKIAVGDCPLPTRTADGTVYVIKPLAVLPDGSVEVFGCADWEQCMQTDLLTTIRDRGLSTACPSDVMFPFKK